MNKEINHLKIYNKITKWSFTDYFLLYTILELPELWRILKVKEDTSIIEHHLRILESLNLIRVMDNITYSLTINEKTYKLFNKLTIKETKDSFELFWDKYHTITGKPKTDKEPAKKKWSKLTIIEKTLALDDKIIDSYSKSVSDIRYIKKCRTYLEDKNFNDEFNTTVTGNKTSNLV